MKKKKEIYYRELKKIYTEDYDSLDEEDSYMALFYLNSFCAERYNNLAEKKYIYELGDLFKHAFSKDAVALGTFHYPDFIHYAKIFIKAGEFVTADEFIKRYSGRVAAEQKENVFNHINALREYSLGNYEKALYSISKVNFPSFILKLQVKLVHLQLLTETKNYEEARAAVHSFTQFLARNAVISRSYRSVINRFLKLCIMLIGVYETENKKEKKQKADEFFAQAEKLSSNLFGIKLWLLERKI